MARPGALPVAVPSEERRRHTRFGTATFHGTLWLVHHSRSATAEYEPCPSLNLSYGGVGFRSPRPLRKGAVCWVLVEVTSPFKDAALATIRVCCSSRAVVFGGRCRRQFPADQQGLDRRRRTGSAMNSPARCEVSCGCLDMPHPSETPFATRPFVHRKAQPAPAGNGNRSKLLLSVSKRSGRCSST